MSKVKIVGNASGSGTLTLTGPDTNSDRTITLPDGTGTLVADDGSGNVDVTGDVTASGSFLVTGDVAAGDDAGIGYNSTQGLILTGQGSSQDVTIKNDANSKVFSINTGTTTSVFEGNVGIGISANIDSELHVYDASTSQINIEAGDGDAVLKLECTGESYWNISNDTSDSNKLTFFHNGGETPLTLDSSGFVGINNTAPNAQLVVTDERSGSIGTVLFQNTHASVEAGDEVMRVQFSGDNDCTGGHFINFFDSGGDIGRVNCASASTVAYATSSDYRLKENVVDITTPITKLKALKPKSFNFIKTPSITQDGFLAHELADVVPIAVSGEKDATRVIDTYDEDGEVNGTETVIDSQGVDNSFVVPLLVGALQEAMDRIETLETKVTALEA